MKRELQFSFTLPVAVCILAVAGTGNAQQKREPVDYVDPNIGSIGQMLTATAPTVKLPFGMASTSPIFTPGITDRYLADKIYGFPAGGFSFMPIAGAAETDAAKNASGFDHDLETTTPYYYKVLLEDSNIQVDYTVTTHALYYRIAFPQGVQAHVLFGVPSGGEMRLAGPSSMSGGRGGRGMGGRYFYVEFSKPVSASSEVPGLRFPQAGRQTAGRGAGAGTGIMADFAPANGETIGIRVGISAISVEQARQNLQHEIPAWNFDQVRQHARDVWDQALNKIVVKGGTEQERTIFYTALYRSFIHATNMTEDDQYFSPGDQKVHPAEGHGFYPMGGGFWGSYRSIEPLLLILDPQERVDLIRSFLALYDQTGRFMGTGRNAMIGHHVASIVLDAYVKGYRDFDLAKAYEGIKKNAMEATMLPWRDGPMTSLDRVYLEKGFFPALRKGEKETVPEVNPFERRQAVGVTLEAAYDDWCAAQIAKILNKTDDYAYFMKRAHNYRNVWDPRVGFMAPKSADGEWVLTPEEFSPIWSGGQGGREYYTEMNAWTYTFHVQQDVAGLIQLMGGREKFAAKLDTLFQEQFRGYHGDPSRGGTGGTKYFFLAQFPDETGLIGQYAQGDEPSFHIPYLYNYAGEPWKTERRVRDIMKIWYNATPLGISGDEDNGEESAWYVLSAMGIFTVCPGRPVYDIGSPIFEESRIALDGGKVFTITAKGVSAVNKYIQSAQLNGSPWNKPWFQQSDMANGGSLVLVMGPRPNKAWGSAPDAAPPSIPN